MADFENFKLYYALSIASPLPASATLFINDTDNTKLIYCNPVEFTKRQTDTSNAQSEDPTKPDTGTARALIEIAFTQPRDTAPTTRILRKLIQMFYLKGDDPDFRKARFGLENNDNPDLDTVPSATNGYKFINFKQEPNPNDPALMKYTVQLEYIGDHTKLGAFL